ncbi:MAG TPA: tetratricopeptide repeat protein [Steroidobacteraceae bacterium]
MKMSTAAATLLGTLLITLPILDGTRAQAARLDAGAITGEHLGSVAFSVSCLPSVQAQFNRGVALLHDFWYEEARPQFARILQADPNCAMAHWGLAMSGFHQIWDTPDAAGMAAGWREMQAAQATAAKTTREREYIGALSNFFRPGNAAYQSRIEAYAAAMGMLYAHFPRDVDAGAFYALALLAAIRPDDLSLTQEHRALAVLTPLWSRYPDHPGLVHYIIHACDSPTLATQGLPAARRYGALAASGAHAVHMPSHIFARLGMWQEDIQANLGSVAATHAAEARHENGWMDQFHADDFLSYAYLQVGEDERARAVVTESAAALAHFAAMPGMANDSFMTFVLANFRLKLPIFFALERHDWTAAAEIEPAAGPTRTKPQVYWARAIADGHLRRARQAHADLAAYDALIETMRRADHSSGAPSAGRSITRGEMLAWVAFADGKIDAAVADMRGSADEQDKVGQDEVDIPAREMLADILLESGQPAAALVEYRKSLQLSPNRFNGLYGAGRAAEASGNLPEARRFFAALLKSTDNGAHTVRPEIAHARAAIGGAPL